MKQTWALFRKDPFYLTRYFLQHGLFLLILGGTLYALRDGIPTQLHLKLYHLAFLPVAMILGIQIPVLMHNCMHGNLRSKALNTVYGELSGFFALMSLGILRINHTLHHAYSDTVHDPHNPSNQSFITFFFTSQLTGARIIEEKFLSYHGQTPGRRALFKLNIFLHYGSHLLRLFVWYMILGPDLFVVFYLPAFVVYSLAFSHVNYITHRMDRGGKAEIINKDDNLYYNFINYIGSGVYYHKNHHQFPKLMNPKNVGGAA